MLAPAAGVLGVRGAPAPSVCTAPARKTPAAYMLIQRRAPTDTLATVTVCLVADTSRVRIAGYHGEVSLGALGHIVHVERPPGATRIENTTVRGQVSFAGVAVQGVPVGPLLKFTLAGTRQVHDAELRLRMLDVTDVDGRDVRTTVQVDSMPCSAPAP